MIEQGEKVLSQARPVGLLIWAYVSMNTPRLQALSSQEGKSLPVAIFALIFALTFIAAALIGLPSLTKADVILPWVAKGVFFSAMTWLPFILAIWIIQKDVPFFPIANAMLSQQLLLSAILCVLLFVIGLDTRAQSDFRLFARGEGGGTPMYENLCGALNRRALAIAGNKQIQIAGDDLQAKFEAMKLRNVSPPEDLEEANLRAVESMSIVTKAIGNIRQAVTYEKYLEELDRQQNVAVSEFSYAYPLVRPSVTVALIVSMFVLLISFVHIWRLSVHNAPVARKWHAAAATMAALLISAAVLQAAAPDGFRLISKSPRAELETDISQLHDDVSNWAAFCPIVSNQDLW